MINQQPDVEKIYLYDKFPYEAKYQLLINKEESAGLKFLNDFKDFIEDPNDMNEIYKNIEKCNILKRNNKKRKILIVFDDMITDMFATKKLIR